MTDQRQIVPPPHLLQQWMKTAHDAQKQGGPFAKTFALAAINWAAPQIATQAADQELEACCEWAAEQDRGFDLELRATRRPTPKPLVEEALEAFYRQVNGALTPESQADADTIRRALERLQELEGQGDG